MAHGHAALLHRGGSQRGESDNIARGINIWNSGAIVVVDGNVAAVVNGEPGFFKSKAVDGSATACGKERGIGFERLAALHREAHACRRILYLHGTFVEQEAHAKVREAVAETAGDFRVKKRQQAVAAIDKRDVDSKSDENRCVFAADHAAADNREAFWDAVHLKKCVRIEGMDVVKGNFGRAVGLRAGGDENDFAAEVSCAACSGDCDGVRVLERRLAANKFDVVQLEIFEDALAFHFDDFALVVHKILNGKVFLERVVDAIKAALLEPRKIEGRFAERLTGDGAGVDAAATHVLGALDDGDPLAKIGGLRTGLFSGGAAADYDEVEVIAGSHLIPHIVRRTRLRDTPCSARQIKIAITALITLAVIWETRSSVSIRLDKSSN